MYTDIMVHAAEQTLQLLNTPVITSGCVEVVRLRCTFDSKWDGMAPIGVFYSDPAKVYHMLMTDGVCEVPWEVLTAPGRLHVGVFGTKSGNVVRTTEELLLPIWKGAPTEQTAAPKEPTPDIYQQLLDAYSQVGATATAAKDSASASAAAASSAASSAAGAKTTAEAAKSTATTAKSTAEAAKSTATTAKSTADAAKSAADAAMPKAGGLFTGIVTLHNAVYAGGCARNILVQNNGGTANESTQYIIMQRK